MVEAVYSPYDWNAIWEVLEDKDFSDDGFCDAEKLFKELDKDGDKRIAAKEIKSAVEDVKTNHWLKHLICVHPTEWDAGQNGSKWQRLKDAPWNFKDKLAPRYDQAIEHIEDMQWWGKVKPKCAALPDPKRVYHFHPVGFMEHFNMLAVPFTMNDAWHIIDVVARAESGGEPNPYAAINDDKEFKGRFSNLNLGYDFVVHIGLSYGIIQFTQDGGSLGKLLMGMHAADSEKFAEVFGDNYGDWEGGLLQVTNVTGSKGTDIWRAAPYNGRTILALREDSKETGNTYPEIRSTRVQKIALNKPTKDDPSPAKEDLWEGVWAKRFATAGTVEAFKQAQRKMAFDAYFKYALAIAKRFGLRSSKGIAIAFDRCVQQGHGSPSSAGKSGNGAWRVFERAAVAYEARGYQSWQKNEDEFLALVKEYTPGSGKKRVEDLLSGEFSTFLSGSGYEISSYNDIT